MRTLNVGCGGEPIKSGKFVNLDSRDYPHIDILHTLGSGEFMHWKIDKIPDGLGPRVPDNYFHRMAMVHVFEHVPNILVAMEELWRVAAPGCSLVIVTPYGSHDAADEDPTHVRRVFKNTYHYFGQGWYGKNDYGYRGDWKYKMRRFKIDGNVIPPNVPGEAIGVMAATMRNVVTELTVELIAVKPARQPGAEIDEPINEFVIDEPKPAKELPKSGKIIISH
jgi:hypothetical protein